MTVVLRGHIIVPDDDLQIVREELPNHIQLTLEELGCLRFDVSADEEYPNRFNVYEEFVDQIAFEHHQKRVAESQWGQVTTNVSRHYQIEESA